MPKNGSKVCNTGKRNNQRINNSSSGQNESVGPVDFLLKSISTRDPNKRKVKPISKGQELLLLDLMNDSSSEDEEYVPKEEADDLEDDASGNSEEEEESSEDEDEANDDVQSPIEPLKSKLSSLKSSGKKGSFLNSLSDTLEESFDRKNVDSSNVKLDITSRGPKLLVCCVCLGDVSHEDDEIVECDNCGITVHEGCYGIIDDSDRHSDDSNASSSSTEPWFCDACLANVTTPSCDLCPNTGGIFKQTDVKRWVHLVCALYIPGVAFADTSRLSGVTLFELQQDRWGSRTCSLCEDERLSRTGICISCDAGLCKAYFHVTCAQSQGLLSEAQAHEETEMVDPFFAHCKLHAGDKYAVKFKRKNWLALQSKIKLRHQQQGKSVNDRIHRKLTRAREKWAEENVLKNISWVPTQKIPRLLTTSSSAVKKLIKKAELLGMSPQAHYIAAQDLIDVRKKWHIPPSFSIEFISYYLDRDSRMSSMRKRIDELKTQSKQLKSIESSSLLKYEEVSNAVNTIKSENTSLKTIAKNFLLLLSSFEKEKLAIPEILQNNESNKKKTSVKSPKDRISSPEPPLLIECGTCKKSHDFQKLVLCDSCKLHYHLYCLDPPLTRMPKKTRFGGWQCSDCTEKEEEEPQSSSEEEISRESSEDGSKRRKLREHVKGPNKFIPDPEFSLITSPSSVKKKKKKTSKSKKSASKKSSTDTLVKRLDSNFSLPLEPTIRLGTLNSAGTSLLAPNPVKKVVKQKQDCVKCKIESELKNLVQCDNCSLYYHFGCCNPPVKKSPKRKGYHWFCEECDNEESDESGGENDEKNESSRENKDDKIICVDKTIRENGECNFEAASSPLRQKITTNVHSV